MSAVEAEITRLVKVDPEKYDDRQDYLAAVARALERINNDDYDNLSEEAYAWHKVAVEALDEKDPIPDMGEAPEDDAEPAASIDDEDEAADDDPEDEAEAEDEEPAPKPKAKTAKKAVEKAKPKAEKPKRVPPQNDVKYTELSGEKDRYGVIEGTKTSSAIKLYEKGATTKQIDEEIGGRFMNILKKLAKDGHKVEKLEGGVWKLTHADDAGKAKPKKGK